MDAINVLSKYLRFVSCSCAYTKSKHGHLFSSFRANKKGVGALAGLAQ